MGGDGTSETNRSSCGVRSLSGWVASPTFPYSKTSSFVRNSKGRESSDVSVLPSVHRRAVSPLKVPCGSPYAICGGRCAIGGVSRRKHFGSPSAVIEEVQGKWCVEKGKARTERPRVVTGRRKHKMPRMACLVVIRWNDARPFHCDRGLGNAVFRRLLESFDSSPVQGSARISRGMRLAQ